MPLHAKAFWAISFFLIGVLLGSAVEEWSSRFLVVGGVAALGVCIFFAFNKPIFAGLFVCMALGAGYFFAYDARTGATVIPFGIVPSASGIVRDVRSGLERQELLVSLEEPHRGRIRVVTNRYPSYAYGDLIHLKGTMKKLRKASARDVRERVAARMSFPDVVVLEQGRGFPLKARLIRIKSFAERTFARVLPPEQAAFLSGLTLGETAEFSKEFREKLQLTGTSHLVALSGYNVTIIAKAIAVLFGLWFSRRLTFWASIGAIIAFVIMTGADASVVRAAIMGSLVLLAEQVGRMYSFRNAIAVAAFLMVLWNPRVLVWDVGFQLSFAAVVGLIYLKPVLVQLFKIPRAPGLFGWRENLWTTISAQLAVLPILLAVFGFFSPLSILVNLLVLFCIPVTMLLGSLIAVSALVSVHLAVPLAWLARIFLGYELGIIDSFSRFKANLAIPGFGLPLVVLYYAVLVACMLSLRMKKNHAAEPA